MSNITAFTQLQVTRSTFAGSSRSEPKASSGTSITRETPSPKQGFAIAKSGLPTDKGKEPMRMANTLHSEDDFIPHFTKSSGETIKKSDIISKDDELLLPVAGHIWIEADLIHLSNVSSEEKNRLCVSHAMKSACYANGFLQDNILAISYRMGCNDRGESNPNKRHFDGLDKYDDANGVHSICPELDAEGAAGEENFEKVSEGPCLEHIKNTSDQIVDKNLNSVLCVVSTPPTDTSSSKDTNNPLPGAFTSAEEDQSTLSEVFNTPLAPKLD